MAPLMAPTSPGALRHCQAFEEAVRSVLACSSQAQLQQLCESNPLLVQAGADGSAGGSTTPSPWPQWTGSGAGAQAAAVRVAVDAEEWRAVVAETPVGLGGGCELRWQA